MNYSIDDLLLGYLQYLATFDVAKKRLYLWKKIYLKNRKTIGKCLSMTTQKINRHIEKLKESGLLSEDSENFYFPYNETGKYKLVNYEMLSYLVNTRNSNAIKIYIYLLNKFQWKENYVFTLKELLVAIGYSENSNNSLASQMVKQNLNCFCNDDIMKISIIQDETIGKNGNIVPVYRYQLDFVAVEPPTNIRNQETIKIVRYNQEKPTQVQKLIEPDKADTFKF